MENRIDILNPIDKSRLKQSDYFRTLVSEAAEKQLLSDFDIEKIQTELIEILHEVCTGVCEKGTSSMRTEDAEEIAASVMYTLSVSMKKSSSPEGAVQRLKKESLAELFSEGRQEIVSILTKARGKWAVICKGLFEAENIFYTSTVKDGMKAFFQNYNYETASHKNIITCDYPLYEENRDLCGAEFIYNYLCSFKSENSFIKNFPPENVHALMLCLDEELKKAGFPFEEGVYKNLPVNIFVYVFAACLALEYVGKDIFTLSLTKEDVNIITAQLKDKAYSDTVMFFDVLADSVCRKLSLDEETGDYLKKAVRILSSEICSVKNNTLTGVFVCRNEGEKLTFEAEKTEKLSDSEYRFILSQIVSADNEDKKLSLITECLNNAEDFADAVKDLSLSKVQIFSCLPSLDMAQKLRLFKRYNVFSYCLSDEDRFMKEVLESYISSLDGKNRDIIMKMLSLMK